MPQFPQTNRPQIDEGKPQLQGSDIQANKQFEETEAPVFDPEGKSQESVNVYDLQQTKEIDLQDVPQEDHPTPDRPTGRMM